MKKFIREFFSWLLYSFERLTHKLPQVSSIYFHDPSPDLFEIVLKWYKKHHYRIISLKELEELMKSRQQPKERVAYISFDDGKRSNLALLPVCEKYKVPITVFVATEPLFSGNYWWEYVEKALGHQTMLSFKKMQESQFYCELSKIKRDTSLERTAMTVDELVKFSKHPMVTIQPHSVNHPILTNISDNSLIKELTESKKQLEELIGDKMDAFSYPNGNVGIREIEALKQSGYHYAFTVQPLTFDVINNNPFLLPRRAMNTNGGKYDNLAKLTGIWYKLFPVK